MTAYVDTVLTVDVTDFNDITVDTALPPDGGVRVTVHTQPQIVLLVPREVAEILEGRIRRARLDRHCDNPSCALRYGHVRSCEVTR